MVLGLRVRPRHDGPLVHAKILVRHDERGVYLQATPQPVAAVAGPVRAVERERTRLYLRDGGPAVRTREALREEHRLARAVTLYGLDLYQALGQLQGCLDRVREAALYALTDHKPVYNDFYVVLVVLVEAKIDRKLVQLAVDPDTGEAALGQLFEHPPVLALASPHHWREHHEARLLGEGKYLLDHLLRRRGGDGEATDVAVRPPCAGVEQTQVVVDLRYRGDRGAGVVGRGLLVDGDSRRETVDVVDVGLIHLAEELPGVGREALHVAALPLRVDGVECKRRLAATREPGHHHHHIARHGDRYVLEVVFARPPHDDLVFRDLLSPLFFGTPQASIRPPVGRPKKQFAFDHILAPQRPISVAGFAIFCP
jgi:hypothetical protein